MANARKNHLPAAGNQAMFTIIKNRYQLLYQSKLKGKAKESAILALNDAQQALINAN